MSGSVYKPSNNYTHTLTGLNFPSVSSMRACARKKFVKFDEDNEAVLLAWSFAFDFAAGTINHDGSGVPQYFLNALEKRDLSQVSLTWNCDAVIALVRDLKAMRDPSWFFKFALVHDLAEKYDDCCSWFRRGVQLRSDGVQATFEDIVIHPGSNLAYPSSVERALRRIFAVERSSGWLQSVEIVPTSPQILYGRISALHDSVKVLATTAPIEHDNHRYNIPATFTLRLHQDFFDGDMRWSSLKKSDANNIAAALALDIGVRLPARGLDHDSLDLALEAARDHGDKAFWKWLWHMAQRTDFQVFANDTLLESKLDAVLAEKGDAHAYTIIHLDKINLSHNSPRSVLTNAFAVKNTLDAKMSFKAPVFRKIPMDIMDRIVEIDRAMRNATAVAVPIDLDAEDTNVRSSACVTRYGTRYIGKCFATTDRIREAIHERDPVLVWALAFDMASLSQPKADKARSKRMSKTVESICLLASLSGMEITQDPGERFLHAVDGYFLRLNFSVFSKDVDLEGCYAACLEFLQGFTFNYDVKDAHCDRFPSVNDPASFLAHCFAVSAGDRCFYPAVAPVRASILEANFETITEAVETAARAYGNPHVVETSTDYPDVFKATISERAAGEGRLKFNDEESYLALCCAAGVDPELPSDFFKNVLAVLRRRKSIQALSPADVEAACSKNLSNIETLAFGFAMKAGYDLAVARFTEAGS